MSSDERTVCGETWDFSRVVVVDFARAVTLIDKHDADRALAKELIPDGHWANV